MLRALIVTPSHQHDLTIPVDPDIELFHSQWEKSKLVVEVNKHPNSSEKQINAESLASDEENRDY